MHGLSNPPVAYSADVETPEPDEGETIQHLIDALKSIADTTFRDHRRGIRSVHAKCHGLLLGELDVEPGLPPEFAQGVFEAPARYPVVIRFSTTPGDPIHDNISLPRAMAIKLVGVDGERLDPGSGGRTQDFVMVNGPVFAKPTAKAFLRNLQLLAKTTDRAEGAKSALSAVLRGAEKAIEAVGGHSGVISGLGGHPLTNILGETFFSQVPLRHGRHIAKASIAPVAASLLALKDRVIEARDSPHFIRDAVCEYFADHDGEWELRMQLCTDLDAMPIEDASVEWSQAQSPFRSVARLRIARQIAWFDRESEALDQRLSFSPWHGVRSHQPLGSVMRARRVVYEAMAEHRARQNGVGIVEPSSVADLRWPEAR